MWGRERPAAPRGESARRGPGGPCGAPPGGGEWVVPSSPTGAVICRKHTPVHALPRGDPRSRVAAPRGRRPGCMAAAWAEGVGTGGPAVESVSQLPRRVAPRKTSPATQARNRPGTPCGGARVRGCASGHPWCAQGRRRRTTEFECGTATAVQWGGPRDTRGPALLAPVGTAGASPSLVPAAATRSSAGSGEWARHVPAKATDAVPSCAGRRGRRCGR